METETKTEPRWFLRDDRDGCVSLTFASGSTYATLTHDDLQAIVQAAYDQYGALATPNLDTEVARVAETNPGLCRCGMPGCSDGDTALRAFADRWGQSLRGRA